MGILTLYAIPEKIRVNNDNASVCQIREKDRHHSRIKVRLKGRRKIYANWNCSTKSIRRICGSSREKRL